MELFEAINNRRTTRLFDRRPVPRPVLERIMHAAIMAPNPLNAQTWRFHVVSGEKRDELAKIISQYPTYMADVLRTFPEYLRQIVLEFSRDLGGAPVIVVISVPALTDSHSHHLDIVAAAAAMQNLLLAAWTEGLGGVPLTSALWVESEIARYLQPSRHEIVVTVRLGYPVDIPPVLPRSDDVIDWLGFPES